MQFQPSTGRRGISEQSMRGASVKKAAAAAGPGDVGKGENLSRNPTIYPVRRRGEQRQNSMFPPQQPASARRLSPALLPDDCGSYREVR